LSILFFFQEGLGGFCMLLRLGGWTGCVSK